MNIKIKKIVVLLLIILSSFLGFSQENENNDIAKELYDNGDFTKENKIPSDLDVYKIKFEKFIDFDTINHFVGINFFRPNTLIVAKKTAESDIKSNKIILKNQKIFFDENIDYYIHKEITSNDYEEFYRFFPIKDGEADRVGMEFSLTNIKNNEQIKDALIFGNIWDKYGNPIYFAFFKSELTKRIDNIKQHNLSLVAAEKEKKYINIMKNIEGFEKKLFPNDCFYVIGIKYRILDFYGFSFDDDFNTKFKQNNTFYNYGFCISNSNNKSDYLPVIERNAMVTEEKLKRDFPIKWEVDSTWVEKKIDVKDFKDLTEPYPLITFKSIWYGLSEDHEENTDEINSILKDKTKIVQYDNLDFWTKKVKDKDLFNMNLFIEFVPYYEKLEIKLYGKMGRKDEIYTIEDNFFFSNVNDETYKLFDVEYHKILNANYIFTVVFNPFLSDFKDSHDGSYAIDYQNCLYDIDDTMLRKLKGLKYLEMFKYRLSKEQESAINNNAQENQKVENEKIKIGLIKKYGKKYVDLAIEGIIVVGMPEGLLPIPLRLWQITSRTNWKDGYRIYCTSKFDSSGKLSVYVQKGKVSMVSY